jgi:hypothetical protein
MKYKVLKQHHYLCHVEYGGSTEPHSPVGSVVYKVTMNSASKIGLRIKEYMFIAQYSHPFWARYTSSQEVFRNIVLS